MLRSGMKDRMKAVKRVIVPALADRGFVSNKRRRVFLRTTEDRGFHLVQIIEFQIGREPFDYWWTLENDAGLMEKNVTEVRDCLVAKGIPWLTEMATLERVRWAMQQLEERKREKANLVRDDVAGDSEG